MGDRKFVRSLFCLLFTILLSLAFTIAYAGSKANIPPEVKEQYKYDTSDDSIIVVKKRLQELGYFSQNAEFSAYINDTLKETVKQFQRMNGLKADGVLDTELFAVLFSDDAIAKNGERIVKATPIMTVTMVETRGPELIGSGSRDVSSLKEDSSALPVITVVVLLLIAGIVSILIINVVSSKKREKAWPIQGESLGKETTEKVRNEKIAEFDRPVQETSEQKKPDLSPVERENQRVMSGNMKQIPVRAAAATQTRRVSAVDYQRHLAEQRALEERKRQEEIQRKQEQRRRKEQEERLEKQRLKEDTETVKIHSVRYNELKNLFDKYNNVGRVRTEFSLSYVFSNKYIYDNVDPQEALAFLARKNDELGKAFRMIGNNRKLKEIMAKENICKRTPAFYIQRTQIPGDRFLEIEKNLCRDMDLEQYLDLEITMYLYYRNGGAHASKTYMFNYDKLKTAYEMKDVSDIEYIGTQEERAKMTPGLRYQILKRDGFRCVICGATAAEGAKLHVDHIMPVSKGGRTEESNLRTLCDKCNMGKHDQYDPDGLN